MADRDGAITRIEVTSHIDVEHAADETIAEIRLAKNQREAAKAYATLISVIPRNIIGNPWPRVNGEIMKRWPKGLDRVKSLAWRIIKLDQASCPCDCGCSDNGGAIHHRGKGAR